MLEQPQKNEQTASGPQPDGVPVTEAESRETTLHWYALKVFFNRTAEMEERLRGVVSECYVPRNVVHSLMFVRTGEEQIRHIRQENYERLMVYGFPERQQPAVISDHDMNVFIRVTSLQDRGFDLLDPDVADYRQGDRIRVTGGVFEGAEGYIKRIRGNRRLVVSIEGVVAVATSYIPARYLQKVENS